MGVSVRDVCPAAAQGAGPRPGVGGGQGGGGALGPSEQPSLSSPRQGFVCQDGHPGDQGGLDQGGPHHAGRGSRRGFVPMAGAAAGALDRLCPSSSQNSDHPSF